MRMRFDDVFRENADGSYSPRRTVRMEKVTLGPGVSFTPAVEFCGVDIASYAGQDLEVEKHPDGTVEIKGIR